MPESVPSQSIEAAVGPTTADRAGADGVLAVVLTFNAPAALERCLCAVRAQTTPPGQILVIDNASTSAIDDVVGDAVVLRLPDNAGPAGGYARGLERFLASDFSAAWLMDDDCVPDPSALATQLESLSPTRTVLATVRTDGGDVTSGHGWLGVLLPRAIVEAVGVPNSELFWWTEDTEYLQWRIPMAGFAVVWTDAPVLTVTRARPDASKPAWKYYYEARNQVNHRMHVQRSPKRPPPHHLKVRVRVWRSASAVLRLAARAVARERDHRIAKVTMVARGTVDGVRGRLGRVVVPDEPDRPVVDAT